MSISIDLTSIFVVTAGAAYVSKQVPYWKAKFSIQHGVATYLLGAVGFARWRCLLHSKVRHTAKARNENG